MKESVKYGLINLKFFEPDFLARAAVCEPCTKEGIGERSTQAADIEETKTAMKYINRFWAIFFFLILRKYQAIHI